MRHAKMINEMKKYPELSDIKFFKMKKRRIKLGDTAAMSYTWVDMNGCLVARFHTFYWWDGKNIEDLKVFGQYRRRGYSYQLLDYATKEFGANNLTVRKNNIIAKHVYDKYGFKVTSEDKENYYMSLKR